MATFGLVHGAWHGAWCWEKLSPELEKLGHRTIAMDLPCDNKDRANSRDYVKVVVEALQGQKDLILVGHSLGGITIPLAADELSVKHLVYLNAVLRRPGHSLEEDNTEGLHQDMNPPGAFDNLKFNDDGSYYLPEDEAIRVLYHDCSPEISKWAASQLRAQFSLWQDHSWQKEWPKIPASSIIASDDRAVGPVWSRRIAKDWLGVEPIEITGSHSSFLSRPAELARILDNLSH